MAGNDPHDRLLAQLRAGLHELAAEDAAELIAGARAEARARVQSMLTEEFEQALLDRVRSQLAPAEVSRSTAEQARTQPTQQDDHVAIDEPCAWYLYGVIGEEELAETVLVEGIEPGHPVATIREGPLAAVVSEVATEDFGEAQLRAHLADMEWVERVARAHEAVLDELRRRTTVIPMRMCTVYRTEDGVREMLSSEADAFAAALTHLHGRTEWGVKVFYDPSGARAQAPASPGADQDPERAGAAYLQRRQREREHAEQAAQLIEQAANDIHGSLSALAADGLIAPSQRPEVSGRRSEMVLNGVYLVDEQTQEEFDGRVRELQDEFSQIGLELELTGPWPAYNFVPGTIGAAW
jgi:hypothetical protein